MVLDQKGQRKQVMKTGTMNGIKGCDNLGKRHTFGHTLFLRVVSVSSLK